MYRRWKSTYTIRWTPILTFTRRYLSLLEWFEANVEPVAFTDNPKNVGIALIADDLRLSVDRAGMTLESGLSGLEIDKLSSAVAGVIATMSPKDMILNRCRTVSTVEIEGADYSETCAQFAVKCSASPLIDGGFRPTDGSALADLSSDSLRMQIEWGIVDGRELLTRLIAPGLSRVDEGDGPVKTMSRAKAHALIGDQTPPVSMFFDIVTRRKTGGDVTGAESIVAEVANLDALTMGVSQSLEDEFTNRRGGDQ